MPTFEVAFADELVERAQYRVARYAVDFCKSATGRNPHPRAEHARCNQGAQPTMELAVKSQRTGAVKLEGKRRQRIGTRGRRRVQVAPTISA